LVRIDRLNIKQRAGSRWNTGDGREREREREREKILTGARLISKLSATDSTPARLKPTEMTDERGRMMIATSSGVSGLP
jgi:hypothetical protein